MRPVGWLAAANGNEALVEVVLLETVGEGRGVTGRAISREAGQALEQALEQAQAQAQAQSSGGGEQWETMGSREGQQDDGEGGRVRVDFWVFWALCSDIGPSPGSAGRLALAARRGRSVDAVCRGGAVASEHRKSTGRGRPAHRLLTQYGCDQAPSPMTRCARPGSSSGALEDAGVGPRPAQNTWRHYMWPPAWQLAPRPHMDGLGDGGAHE